MLSRTALLAARNARLNARTPAIARALPIPLSVAAGRLPSFRSFESAATGGLAKKHDKKKTKHEWNDRRESNVPKEIPRSTARNVREESSIRNDAQASAAAGGSASTAQRFAEAKSQSPTQPDQPFKLPDLTQGIPPTLAGELEKLQKSAKAQDATSEVTPSEGAASSVKLPDLTKGIPPTLLEELEKQQRAGRTDAPAEGTALNVAAEPSAGEGEGGQDGPPRSSYVSSGDRKKAQIERLAKAAFLFFITTVVVYFGRDWDTKEEREAHAESAPSGWSPMAFWARIKTRMTEFFEFYTEPAFTKLLPDPDPSWERPFTLVLSLEDMLVHSEWSREHGWRTAKRPGVDYFLQYLSQYYELVVFTSLPSHIAEPIIRKLDPYRFIMWPLFREATRYKKGEYIKDLSYLNRPLQKVILLDTEAAHTQAQPDNAVILKKWDGSLSDKGLVAMIPFLEYIATMGITDIPSVIRGFAGTDVPVEFARREAIAREKFEKQLAEERKSRRGRTAPGLMSMLGLKNTAADGSEAASEGFEKGKMLQDQARERGQRTYELMAKELREKGEEWLAEFQAEEKKMQDEAMKSMKTSFTGFFGVPSDEASEKK